MKEQTKRSRSLKIRLTDEELLIITKGWKSTIEVNRTAYARDLLLQKPVVASYRNRSLDDMMAELIRLRKELNNIGNNFNQAVHKLHMVDNIPELKAWLRTYDLERTAVAQKVAEIHAYINQIGDVWLQ